ncbi:MAG TPA: biotin--[acetyl-CoA-carboxylase] ligase [Candidatus Baltobacteraceae bacterium]|jgi:BirA family biotin operon repressor/biotin-[acetyl-CoA-carboxylase] ligase|nr:biotin--[acetyl-CoA-carboxylase] ligase [Candidatus Baltobacteraceae bacterium]
MGRFSRIERVAVTGSTNEDLARILGEEHARGLTLVADYQERGSGRKGRAWIAPPGSALLCTIGLSDPLPSADLWAVPFWAALVVANALGHFSVAAQLQWPNDILLDGQKLAGILCISRVTGDYAWTGCGIGVNVLRPAEGLPGVEPPPAFLSDVAEIDHETLLQEVLATADQMYDLLTQPQQIAHAWEREAGLPQRYRLQLDSEPQPFEATALRLLPGGSLLVEQDATRREISLADARVLR